MEMLPNDVFSSIELIGKVTVLLVLGLGLTAALKRAHVRLRHDVLALSVLAALILPLAMWMGPTWKIIPADQVTRSFNTEFLATNGHEEFDSVGTESITAAETAAGTVHNMESRSSVAYDGPSNPIVEAVLAGWLQLSSWSLVTWLTLIWMGGLSLLILSEVRSALLLHKVWGGSSSALPESWVDLIEEAADRVLLKRDVSVRLSDDVSGPMSWGLRTPKIVLPAEADRWDDTRVLSVLMHEMEHVNRFDAAYDGIARLLRAIHWFNPMSWVVLKRLRSTRELACDQAVVSGGMNPELYAQTLIDVAKSMAEGKKAMRSSLTMARPSQLEGRILAIMASSGPRSTASGDQKASSAGIARPLLGLVLAGVMLVTAAASPQSLTTVGPESLADSESAAQPGAIEGGAEAQTTPVADRIEELNLSDLDLNDLGLDSIVLDSQGQQSIKDAFAIAGVRAADAVLHELGSTISRIDWSSVFETADALDGFEGEALPSAGEDIDEAMAMLSRELESVVVNELIEVIIANPGTKKASRAIRALEELDTPVSREALRWVED